MTSNDILVLLEITLLLFLLPAFGLSAMFKKAGIPAWKAYVPFYNTWVILKTGERPMHWFFWQFIPIVGWFVTLGI